MSEGTRSKKGYWMPCFYFIAASENIHFALGYIDYQNKVIGIGDVIQLSTIKKIWK